MKNYFPLFNYVIFPLFMKNSLAAIEFMVDSFFLGGGVSALKKHIVSFLFDFLGFGRKFFYLNW